MRLSPNRLSRPAAIALAIGTLSASAAGAAGVHRFVVTQGTGSNGSTNFLNSSPSGSALEGNVEAADTTYPTPFGLLGAVNNPATGAFGIGVLGASTTGYGVAGSSYSDTQPSVLAYPGGQGIRLESTTLSML